jgi:diguanylate cyclase (GGDEF)-like protein
MLLDFFEGRPAWSMSFICLVITAFIGVVDIFIGPEISSAIFYVVPVGIAAWYGTLRMGIVLSIAASLTWIAAEDLSRGQYSSSSILYWNAFVRLQIFLIIAYLLSKIRRQLEKERDRADTDSLTGVLSNRAFYERAEQEIHRARRYGHPFTVTYIDLDNFKMVNDAHGHTIGDILLRTVASLIKTHLRKTDVVARLGGDEFAILFVETDVQASSGVLQKLRSDLHDSMQKAGWPVTFSIGMVTYKTAPSEVRQMIKMADDLMYSVKKHGKNGVIHSMWEADTNAINSYPSHTIKGASELVVKCPSSHSDH